MDIVNCSLCKLAGKEYAFPRVNRGNGKKVMFIGEAPGEEEGKQHRAFVGRSGKLLDKWINQLEIDNYYITNIVKHRPPNNRQPDKDEVWTCIPYLHEEIKEELPDFIILLGKTALNSMFSNLAEGRKMSDIINNLLIHRLHYKYRMRIFLLYHPSYILRTNFDMAEILIKLKNEIIKI